MSEKEFQTTPLQQQIYKFQVMNPKSTAYNLNYLFKLTGKVNLGTLKKAVEKVLNSYDIFKVRFTRKGGSLVQILKTDFSPKVEVNQDIKDVQEIYSNIQDDVREVMDMEKIGLVKAAIYITKETYFLHLKIHHSIIDAMSVDIILKEIESLYVNPNEQLKRSNNFFEATKFIPENQKVKKAIDFVRSMFEDTNGFSTENLETDFDNNGTLIGDSFDNNMNYEILEKLARNYNVTVFELLFGLYTFVLSQMTYSKKVSIGVPFGNRKPNYLSSVGLFVNTVPIRISLENKLTFSELLVEIKNKMKLAKKYQDVDLIGSQSEIFDNNDLSAINCTLTYYKNFQSFSLPNAQVKKIPIYSNDLIFPFSIVFEREENKLLLHVTTSKQYSNTNFGKLFSTLANQLIINQNIKLDDLHLMEVESELEMIKKINESDTNYIKDDLTVVDLFQERLNSVNNNEAVKYNQRVLKYSDVNRLSNSIASYLNAKVGSQNIVVSITASEKLIPLILGIFKAGKTYIPIDNTMPFDRKEMILNELGDYFLIQENKSGINIKEDTNESITIDQLYVYINDYKTYNLINKADSDKVAYILFTSGSTGIPKGVQVTHRNIRSLFNATSHHFRFSSKDVWTLFHSYSFDFSIWEIFGALVTGGKLVVVPSTIKMYPDLFYNLLNTEKVTIVSQTPSAFTNLLTYEASRKSHSLNFIRYFFLGGEIVTHDSIKKWYDFYDYESTKFINVYGVTEAAVFSVIKDISKYDAFAGVDVIGKPLPNSHVFVRGINNQLLPKGFLGEIVLSGEGVGTNYFNGNELQSQSFANNNIFFEENTFYTKDLGSVNTNYDLVYKIRADKQVKISGHRIEIGEVESAIRKFHGCYDAVVIPWNFHENDQRLVGYYVPENTSNINREELREFLKNKLQAYMIPSYLIEILEKPLTVNGKLDIKALPVPEVNITNEKDGNKEVNQVDKIIRIWSDTLKHSNIEPTDNFFDVGGSSILITEIYYRILDEFSLDNENFSMMDLFEYSTPNEISDFIEEVSSKELYKD